MQGEILNQLYKIAVSFRQHLVEIIQNSTVGIDLQNFPGGACETTSILLGHYLLSKGYETTVVYASRYERDYAYLDDEIETEKGHVWLNINDNIIDITADQFEDCNLSVIVSDNSDFHDTFKIKSQTNISKEILKPPYNQTYNEISRILECT